LFILLAILVRLILVALFGDWLPALNFILQLVALGVLAWYAYLTRLISIASQEQAEGGQRPCLTVVTAARGYEDAVLEAGGAVGGMVVAARDGNVALWNVGNGPALNTRYRFTPINPPPNANAARPSGYIQIVAAQETFVLPVSRTILPNLQYEVVLTYESLGGKRYETRIPINNLVLTGFSFGRL
jgi:hypothetical protein